MMKILLITVLLCVVFQHSNAAPTLDMFALYETAYERQKAYETEWGTLVDKKDTSGNIVGIEKSKYYYADGIKTGDFYKLTGADVRNYKLTEVFYMLQNWAVLPKTGPKPVKFQVPIAGEDFEFHLRRDTNNQILVLKEGKLVEYKFLYEDIRKGGYDEANIAKMMLDSSRETLSGQTPWTGLDAETAKHMRTLMVIGQVAEAARPKEEYYKEFKRVMEEVTEIEKLSSDKIWKLEMNEFLKNYGFDAFSKDTEYDDLHKKVAAYSTETDTTKRNKLRLEISKLISPSSSNLAALKKITLTTKDNQVKTKIRALCKKNLREFPKPEQYDKLIEGARELAAGKNDIAAEKKIRDNLPPLYRDTIDHINEYRDVSIVAHNKWVTRLHEIPKVPLKVKTAGRVPGADSIFRDMLQRIIDRDPKAHFTETSFNELFILSQRGGTKMGREAVHQTFGKRGRPISDGDDAPKAKIGAASDAATGGVISAATSAIASTSKLCPTKRSAACSFQGKLKLVENSFDWKGNILKFETVNEEGRKQSHQIEVDADKLGTSDFTKERIANVKETRSIKGSSVAVARAGRGLGVFGTFVSVLATGQYYSKGEHGRAMFSSAEVAHSIGGLTGFNDVVKKVSKRAFENVITKTAKKIGLQKTMKSLSALGAKAAGKSGAKVLGRLAGNIPFVGIAFDIYAIAEDIKDLADKNSPTPLGLKIGHLVLDVTLAALSIVEAAFPILAPITQVLGIALTIIRIAMDDFYLNIKEELDKVKGKGFGVQLLAFMKGFANGIVDVLTLGLGRQLRALEEEKAQNEELLRNLSNPANYFELTIKGEDEDGSEVGTVDFTAGVSSQFGGFLDVKLNEDGMSFTVTLPTVPTGTHAPTVNTETFPFDRPVSTIILGVGELSHPVYRRETAKLWMFIPVKSYDVIDRFEAHKSSRYGVYTGNDKDNEFFAMQRKKRAVRSKHSQLHQHLRRSAEECESRSNQTEVRLFLSSYHYDLYGRGGDDKFFLGPQSSHVYGEEGNDVYFVPAAGGRAIINNFALDEEMDTLFLNVSYSNIRCYRDGENIIVSYCNTHSIKLKNWFISGIEQFHRHIYLTTKDGVGIQIVKTEISVDEYQVTCDAVSVDRHQSKSSQSIELTGSFSNVQQVTGSDHDDTIVGSDGNNVIKGGLGNDYLKGGDGVDVYLIKEGDGVDRIDNSATDEEQDSIVFEIPYTQIRIEKSQLDLLLYDSLNPDESKITVISWFSNEANRHAIFISKDWINFFVETDITTALPKKVPVTIDLKKNTNRVIVDLNNPTNSQDIVIDVETAQEVKSVFDSPYNDVIRGNEWGNVMSCTGGSDILRGNGGKDTYVIKSGCVSATIENYNELQEFDMILFECDSENIHLSMTHCSNDLLIKCQDDEADKIKYVLLKKWFQGSNYTHLMIKTSDKVLAFLPESKEEFQTTNGQILPREIESDKDCGGEIDIIDLTAPSNVNVERFVANTDACSIHVIGNAGDNYIDPGPDNPYGYQNLAGGNGTDTYVIGYDYGLYNQIENHAEDGELDHVLFQVLFNDIYILRDADHVILTSSSQNDSVKIIIIDYFKGEAYQHLIVHSADNVLFKLTEMYPYMEIIMVDFSSSPFSQIILGDNDSLYKDVVVIVGSGKAENRIEGSSKSTKITGGNANDTIIGGVGNETLIGLDGNDYISGYHGDDEIFGGDGDDALLGGLGYDSIYGGYGADTIDGGEGLDSVVFSGEYLKGVHVNIMLGIGLGADAEGDTYESIENILGSEFDDFLHGNDDDNIIRGYGGSDYIVPMGGEDILQGGLGSDIYQFDHAFGPKIINNFATDKELDLLLMNKTLSNQMCYFFVGEELEIVISYDINTPEAVARLHRDESYLQISLAYWLRNTTYQHLAIKFSDEFVTEEEFTEIDSQFGPLVATVENEEFLSVFCTEQHRICLRFTYNSSILSIASSHHVTLEYVRINNDSITYHPLALSSGVTDKIEMDIEITGLEAGTDNKFMVKLTSCHVVAGLSKIISATTIPNRPSNFRISSTYFNGFTAVWDPPSVDTDPNVNDYQYVITVSNQQGNENYEFTTTSLTYTTHRLNPDTSYTVFLKSQINDVVSDSTPQVTLRTTTTPCLNFLDLSPHLYIEKLELNSQQIEVAHFHCDAGYSLVGSSTAVCNEPRSELPSCIEITCVTPIIENANLVVDGGDVYTWHCHHGYEVRADVDSFSSICSLSTADWSPALQTCHLKPTCETLTAPAFGQVSITTGYVGDTAIYSCPSGYELEGPIQKTCMRVQSVGGQESIYWDPNADVRCVAKICPDLLPQEFGEYSRTGIFYSGDSVTLTCYSGYYIQDDYFSPYSIELLCQNGLWNVHQRTCQPIIEVYNIIEQLYYVIADVRYSLSSWATKYIYALDYREQACNLLGTSDRNAYAIGSTIYCNWQGSLTDGTADHNGIYSIIVNGITNRVCVTQQDVADNICSTLGYGQYTTSIFESAISLRSTKVPVSNTNPIQLSSSTQDCTDRIQCRHRCTQLTLLNGNDCDLNYEGDNCYFSCNPGYGMIGSSVRTCSTRGWSGSHTSCDGKF